MAVTLRERRRAGFRALWLSAIVFAALVAAVIIYELPDWASLLVFVVAFVLGGRLAAKTFGVLLFTAQEITVRQLAQRPGQPVIAGGVQDPHAVHGRRAGVGFGHNFAAHAAPPAANSTDGSEIAP